MSSARTLGAQAEIIMGQSPPGDSYNSDGIGTPLLNGPTEFGATHPTEKQWTTSPTRLCRAGDILFCVRGATAGRTNVADKEYCLGRGLAAVRALPGRLDPEFLNHILSAGYSHFQAKGVGSTFINISSETLAKFELPDLPLDVQRRAARILDAASEVRAKRAITVEKCETLKQSIFAEMFEVVPASPKHVPMETLVEEFRYGTSNKSGPHGYTTLRIPNVVGGGLDLSELKLVPAEKSELDRLRLQDGDLLFVRTNGNPDYVGRCAVFDSAALSEAGHDPSNWIFASYLIRARLHRDRVDPVYLREYLSTAQGQKALRERSKTSAGQFNINTEGLGSLPILLPPISDQARFARRVAGIDSAKKKYNSSSSRIDDLFASLQSAALQGKL